MKKPGAEVALLTPSANGWRLSHARTVKEIASLSEAIALVPAAAPLHLALPCHTALLERFTLPSSDRAELAGMAQLQLEKTLPYPLEEVTSDLEVVEQGTDESTVLSIAVHTPVLEQLCAPFRQREHLPERITLFAQQAAARAPRDGHTLLIWKEQDNLVVAIAEKARLSWAQTIPGGDADALVSELPGMLLAAEMNGVPTQFARALLAHDCASLSAAVTVNAGCPVELFSITDLPPAHSGNLLPPGWAAEANRAERSERFKQHLLVAAVVYLLLVALAFLYLAWTKRKMQALDQQIARTRPLIEATQAQQNKWQALTPAIEPGRYVVEVAWLVYKARPSPGVHITQFDMNPAQFMVEGEAPSAAEAIDFLERLKAEPGLSAYRIEAGNPVILPNESAQFRIFGKL
jgi:hypothetical protein